MKNGTRLVALLVALLLLASGCYTYIYCQDSSNGDDVVLAEMKDGQVTLAQAQAEFDEVLAYYESYGVALDNEEDIAYVKADILDWLSEDIVMQNKAKELGLYESTPEQAEAITQQAKQDFADMVEYYMLFFSTGEEGETEESLRQEVIDTLREDQGYTEDIAVQDALEMAWQERLYDYATKDVEPTEEDIQATYEEMVALDQENYQEDPYNFEYAALSGSTIFWYPEGYRTVKHILLSFTDEQVEALADLSAQLDDVLWQIEELDWMEENEDEDWTEDDWTDEDLVGLDEPEDAEDEPAMSREELEAEQMRLEAELAQMQSEYAATLSDLVAEVQAKIAQGEDFEALIDEYGSDVGMQEEPGLSQGYYVAAGSEMWEQVFTDAAMALEKPGDVSEPVVGSNGIHLIRYMADVTPGAVDLETVREACVESAAEVAKSDAYDQALAQWKEEAQVVTYPERWT